MAAILTGGQNLSNQLNGSICAASYPGVDLVFTKADPATKKVFDETVLNRPGIRIRINSEVAIFHNNGGTAAWGLKYIDDNGNTVGPISVPSLIGVNPFWDVGYTYTHKGDTKV